jgi:hypothetical protein
MKMTNTSTSNDKWWGSRQMASRILSLFLVCLFFLYFFFYSTDNFLGTTNENDNKNDEWWGSRQVWAPRYLFFFVLFLFTKIPQVQH